LKALITIELTVGRLWAAMLTYLAAAVMAIIHSNMNLLRDSGAGSGGSSHTNVYAAGAVLTNDLGSVLCCLSRMAMPPPPRSRSLRFLLLV
jgi:hypothetical protein